MTDLADDADRAQALFDAAARAAQRDRNDRFVRPGHPVTECQQCGEDIPVERLAAIPGIQLCVHCAAKHDVADRLRAGPRR